jgi:hypothetical protein
MLNSILVRARAHHADVLRQAGSCPSDPAKRQKMKQACRAVGTDCTTHPVSVCTLSLRSSGHFCSCTTVSLPHLTLLATPCSLPPTMCAAHAFCKPPASSTAPAVLPLRALSCAGNAGIRVQTTFKPLTCPTSPSLQNPTLCRRPYSPPEQFARTQHRAHRLLCCHDARRRALEAQVSGFKQHTLHHSRSNRSR